jgi:hypothetical protein
MATTIAVTCPECHKQIKAPAELQGKKIRCKTCSHVFTVKAASAAKPKPVARATQPKAKTEGPIPLAGTPPAHDDLNPYVVNEEKLPPRCPQCAEDLESEEVILCLNCGYNLQTRTVMRPKRTYETTALDWILWLAPGVFCVLFALAVAAFDIYYIFFVDKAGDDEEWYKQVVTHGFAKVWVTVLILFAIFNCGRFAIKRLIRNPVPPEREK